jgi:uncharacterized integral membrane protein
MPWKFIGLLIILILFVIFIGLNLENKTTVSLGFYSFENVPAFLIVIVSFIIGALITLPVSLFKKFGKKIKSQKQIKKQEKQENQVEVEKGKKNKRK